LRTSTQPSLETDLPPGWMLIQTRERRSCRFNVGRVLVINNRTALSAAACAERSRSCAALISLSSWMFAVAAAASDTDSAACAEASSRSPEDESGSATGIVRLSGVKTGLGFTVGPPARVEAIGWMTVSSGRQLVE